MDRIDSGLTSTKDDDTRSKSIAYKRREWLSALLETGNEKVIAAYQKYEQINPAPIKHPGFNCSTEIWAGSTSPLTVEKLSSLSNAQIAEYLINFKETEVFRKSDPTERGLAQTLEKCVEADPQKFTDNLLPFQDVSSFYQSSLLHGSLKAWRDEKPFDWFALLKFICKILSFEHFWSGQYKVGFNYRNWILSTAADLIREGTKDDKHAFDVQFLPLAEEILLILVEKAEPSIFAPKDSSLDALSSDRGKVFSAMINYALRVARINEDKLESCRWTQSIKTDFTNRLDRSVEPSLEFSYTLGFYLPNLLYLDEHWVVSNIDHIFPQQNEDHWQAAFSGYLLHPVREEFYLLLKAHRHYQKALNTPFTDAEVLNALVNHICTRWIEDSETLEDKTSLIYQLIHSGNPNLLAGMVYFFSRRADNLSDKVKIKVISAWRALFEVLSEHRNEAQYQKVLSPLSQWIGLIDEIDDEVLTWIKVSMNYLNKVPGYAFTLSSVIEALQKHALTTPEKVGEIYLEIPKSEMWYLQGMKKGDIEKTVRILYEKGHNGIADEICIQFAKANAPFLKSVYEEYQNQP